MTYVIENWLNTRHGLEEIKEEVSAILEDLNPDDIKRLNNAGIKCYDDWLNVKNYSPDKAEDYRRKAQQKITASGVKQ